MKCPSVAALWPEAPPSHLVTAAVVLPNLSALFTGGSDGSIVHWSLITAAIRPSAILCGHATAIAGLITVSPSLILSACAAGVLCLWSAATAGGRCNRRRKLPPWAGAPLILSTFPSSCHVAVLCGSGETRSHHLNEVDLHAKRSPKYAVLIVDSISLNVVKTVFHGSLSIGRPLSMVVIELMEDLEGKRKQDVTLVDAHGLLQFLEVLESDHDNHSGTFSLTSSSSDTGPVNLGQTSHDLVQSVAFDEEAKIMALVYGSHCLIKWLADGVSIGEISLVGTSLCKEGSLIGGVFLQDGNLRAGNSGDSFVKNIALWSANGVAIVYRLTISIGSFNFESVCEIPYIITATDGKATIWFRQFNKHLIRVHCHSFTIEGSLLWKPYISTWSMERLEPGLVNNFSGTNLSHILAEGGFTCGDNTKERIVSSSMVLSEDSLTPYAIVYGFYSGEIEVIRFMELKSSVGGIYPQISEKIFTGHTSPILCLATHQMHNKQSLFSRALVSGSQDCTIRVWDLDTGDLLSVLHHHVAPVRQILLPPAWTQQPWNDCFLSVGDDNCVSLISLETMRVERMFPGHVNYPSMVAWDSNRGYIACLCQNFHSCSDSVSVLYLWDVKTGASERIIRGVASHSMFEHFCKGIHKNAITGSILGGTTSASSLLVPVFKDSKNPNQKKGSLDLKGKTPALRPVHDVRDNILIHTSTNKNQKKKLPVKCSCPFPGIASLRFDLSALMSPISHISDHESKELTFQHGNLGGRGMDSPSKESPEGRLLRFSLCFLHVWDVDRALDKLIVEEMNVCKPEGCHIAAGIIGDRGSVTLMFPGMDTTLELWKSSPEFCAMRSLAMVSLAQHMITLSRSCSNASSVLAAFYTRNFAEKVPDIKPPLLQLLVSFWQHPCEHVRMAARSLFHCVAPRAVPHPLFAHKTRISTVETTSPSTSAESNKELETSRITEWLESFEDQDWVSWIGLTNQDSMASNIIVAAALVVWYPSIVKDPLGSIVVHQLVKLLMSMNDRYSPTAAELLAEGMESTWKDCLGAEISHFIGDVFLQIECLSGAHSTNTVQNTVQNTVGAVNIREALIGVLLPSLAMADIMGFFGVIESQIWGTSSDSSVHLVSLKTLIRVVRGSPKLLAPYLEKVVNYVLHTMDPSNLVMRKACLNTSIVALREITRVFPMVSLNESFTQLAAGDAIGDVTNTAIRVYDLESVTKIRILDASAPPGLPSLLEGASTTRTTTAISALSFSPDGEGLVAFSENGLMIRWWSLGTAWWERLSSRSLVLVQCTKLIYVPPWEGFSPNSTRLSIMATILGHDKRDSNHKAKIRDLDGADQLRLLIHNLDLSYRLQWVGARTVKLTRQGQDLGAFQIS